MSEWYENMKDSSTTAENVRVQAKFDALHAALAACQQDVAKLSTANAELEAALAACEARVAEHDVWAVGMAEALSDAATAADAALAREATLRGRLSRAAYVAEHLMQMIDRETWRAHGADDGQGHYEGDYHEAQLALEVKEWVALSGEGPPKATCNVCKGRGVLDDNGNPSVWGRTDSHECVFCAGEGPEATCPVCRVERADYEGPDGAWLPTCPNCGAANDPVREGPEA